MNKKILVSTLVCSSLSLSSHALASMAPQTSFESHLGGKLFTHNIAGELNFTKGITNATDHMYNSWLDLSTATSLYNGLDFIAQVGIESEVETFTPNQEGNKYQEAVKGDIQLGYNGHSIKGGYDDVILKKIFNPNLQSHLDVGNTENPIGSQISERGYFAEYGYTIMNTAVGVGILSGGQHYFSVNSYQPAPESSPYFDGMELGAVLFEDVDGSGAGMFFTGTTTLHNNINLSVGAGTISNTFSYTASANYVMNEYLGVSMISVGDEEHSTVSAGVDLAYDNFITYVDVSADLSKDGTNDRENRLAFGFKVVF